MDNNPILNTVYKSIIHSKKSYGHLLKTELHIHTPASHDYKLVPGKQFKDLSLEEVLDISIVQGLFTKEFVENLLSNDIEIYEKRIIKDMNEKFQTNFKTLKEIIGYQLIAHKLFDNDIKAAVITDHNTIEGFKKLRATIVDYYRSRIKVDLEKECIVLFLGVEISCSDRYHLVAIFDSHKFNVVNEFIDKYIHSKEEGTYISCLDMVKRVSEHNGIPYIAHLNSSEFLGTNLYKRSLFGLDQLNIIGLTNMDRKEWIKDNINSIQGKLVEKFCFLYEGDSHELNEIGKKNTWIKFNKVNFNSLNKALKNHEYCVYTTKPENNDRFIKGVYIDPGKTGFLSTKEQQSNPFIVDFSRDLNCLIGGRGVGKSTVLNILETAFTLEFSTEKYIKFISQHKVIYIVFYYKGKDYILKFLPQTGKEGYVNNDFFLRKAFLESVGTKEGKKTLAPHWISLFRIENNNNKRVYEEVNETKAGQILEAVYKKSYSINNIVEQINSGKISDFIREVVMNGDKFSESKLIISKLNSLNQNKYRKYLRENLKVIDLKITERKKLVYQAINEFNAINKHLIEIIYSPKIKNPSAYIDELDIYYNELLDKKSDKQIQNTYLTWDDIEKFLYDGIKEFGYLTFLELILNKKTKIIESKLPLSNYISDFKKGEYDSVNSTNLSKIYNQIERRIFRDVSKVTRSIEHLLYTIDDFSLHFNVNSKESVLSEQVMMRDIEELSLGQKVVAILSLIFNYGEHSNDSTPLVIDQPEDNLDNLYIFQNLVKSLRKIKNKRQVIISTHSATIVTNADAEQVIILESDNKKGWLLKKGYPDDRVVLNHIVSILEGGQESFIHKKDTYKTVLDL